MTPCREKTLELATALFTSEATQPDEIKIVLKKRSPPLKKKLASPEEPGIPPGFSGLQPSSINSLTVTGAESNPCSVQAGRDPAPGLKNPEVTRPPGFEAVNDVQQKASIVAEWPGLLSDKQTVSSSPQELPSSSDGEHAGPVQPMHSIPGKPWIQKKVTAGYEHNFPSLAVATAVQNENNEEFTVTSGSQVSAQVPKSIKFKNRIDVRVLESSREIPSLAVESKMSASVVEMANGSDRSDSSTTRKVLEGKVVERVLTVLGKDKSKFKQFKSLSGWYKNNEISVQEYYSQCSALFGSVWKDIGPQVASVLPDKSKKIELEDMFGPYARSASASKRIKSKKSKPPPATVWASGPPVGTTHPPSTKQPPPPAPKTMLSESDYPSLGTASDSKVNSVQGNWSMVVRS